MWYDSGIEADRVRPNPGKASPGTLKLAFGNYVILSDFGRCYVIVDDEGRTVAGQHAEIATPLWMVRRKGLRALKRLQNTKDAPALEPVEVVVDKDRYIQHLEQQLEIGAT